MAAPSSPSPDVPKQVFNAFLDALAQKGVAAETIARLRQNLLEKRDLSEKALRNAVAPEETLP